MQLRSELKLSYGFTSRREEVFLFTWQNWSKLMNAEESNQEIWEM